jgi:hypothetical protein
VARFGIEVDIDAVQVRGDLHGLGAAVVLAPATSRRGRMVSAAPSSAESSSTFMGSSGRWPSGIGEAVETRPVRSTVIVDLSRPGHRRAR